MSCDLTYREMKELQDKAGVDSSGHRIVVLLRQFCGGLVQVPPGWWHWVVNMQPNVKLVLDGYVDSHFVAYMQSLLLVRSPHAQPTNPEDYTSIFTAVVSRMR